LKGEVLIDTNRDATDLTVFAGLIEVNNRADAGELYLLQRQVRQTMSKERTWNPGGLQHNAEAQAEMRALRQQQKLERDLRAEFVRAFLLDQPEATAKQIHEQAPPELQLSSDMSKRLRREIRREQADIQRVKNEHLVNDVIRMHRDKLRSKTIAARLGISKAAVIQMVENLGTVYEIAARQVEAGVQECRADHRAVNEAAVQVLISGRPNITARQVVDALSRLSIKQAERLLTKLRPKDPTREQTIRQLHEDGWSNKSIAELLGCCVKTVCRQLEKQAA
jgi:predicted transcriptional regulator